VWFASVDHREFFWASKPEARHSQNIAQRPDVAVVVFDSSLAPFEGLAVYASAVAELVPEADLDGAVAVYTEVSQRQGLRRWTGADLRPPSRLRLYRATATEHWLLNDDDERIPVDPTGR
jgi:hypothetical protein